MANKSDVEILLELYHGLMDINKTQGNLIDKIMDSSEKNNNRILDLMEDFLTLNDNNMKSIKRHENLIEYLLDEVFRLNLRVIDLEKEIKELKQC